MVAVGPVVEEYTAPPSKNWQPGPLGCIHHIAQPSMYARQARAQSRGEKPVEEDTVWITLPPVMPVPPVMPLLSQYGHPGEPSMPLRVGGAAPETVVYEGLP